MSENELVAGDTVYDGSGVKYAYVGPVTVPEPHGVAHVVRPFILVPGWEGEEDEQEAQTCIVIPEAFAEPPKMAVIQEIAELRNQAIAFRAEIEQLRREKSGVISESFTVEQAAKKTLEKWAGYSTLLAFLEGRITHLVLKGWQGMKIVEFTAYMDQGERYERRVKLLSLFGDSKGDLTWKLSKYSDGSGDWDETVPFCSLEEAQGYVQTYLDGLIAAVVKKDGKWNGRFDEIKRTAAMIGAELPPNIAAAIVDVEWDSQAASVAKAQKALDEAAAALHRLPAPEVPASPVEAG